MTAKRFKQSQSVIDEVKRLTLDKEGQEFDLQEYLASFSDVHSRNSSQKADKSSPISKIFEGYNDSTFNVQYESLERKNLKPKLKFTHLSKLCIGDYVVVDDQGFSSSAIYKIKALKMPWKNKLIELSKKEKTVSDQSQYYSNSTYTKAIYDTDLNEIVFLQSGMGEYHSIRSKQRWLFDGNIECDLVFNIGGFGKEKKKLRNIKTMPIAQYYEGYNEMCFFAKGVDIVEVLMHKSTLEKQLSDVDAIAQKIADQLKKQ